MRAAVGHVDPSLGVCRDIGNLARKFEVRRQLRPAALRGERRRTVGERRQQFGHAAQEGPLRTAARTIAGSLAAGADQQRVDPDEAIDARILGQGIEGRELRGTWIESHHFLPVGDQNDFSVDERSRCPLHRLRQICDPGPAVAGEIVAQHLVELSDRVFLGCLICAAEHEDEGATGRSLLAPADLTRIRRRAASSSSKRRRCPGPRGCWSRSRWYSRCPWRRTARTCLCRREGRGACLWRPPRRINAARGVLRTGPSYIGLRIFELSRPGGSPRPFWSPPMTKTSSPRPADAA